MSKSVISLVPIVSAFTALCFKYIKIHPPIQFYTAGVVTCLAGLISSQLATHYLYLKVSDQVTFERRWQAAEKTEEKRRKEIIEWQKQIDAKKKENEKG